MAEIQNHPYARFIFLISIPITLLSYFNDTRIFKIIHTKIAPIRIILSHFKKTAPPGGELMSIYRGIERFRFIIS